MKIHHLSLSLTLSLTLVDICPTFVQTETTVPTSGYDFTLGWSKIRHKWRKIKPLLLLLLSVIVMRVAMMSSITMMLKSIDEDEKLKISPKQSLGLLTNNNEYWFLTEDGLYEVLMQSRKPIAKLIRTMLTSEV